MVNIPSIIKRFRSSLLDTASRQRHSEDFDFVRAEYLRVRVLFVGAAFFLLAPLWIAVDYHVVPRHLLDDVIQGRIAMMLSFLAILFYVRASRYRLRRILHSLAALLLIPAFFYAGLLLSAGQEMSTQVGYGFIPLLLTAVLSVFPLTLLESLGIGLLLLGVQLLSHAVLGETGTAQAWQDLWLLCVVLVISLWANFSQVSTLLRLYRQARLDPLTQLFNRRALLENLSLHVGARTAASVGTPFCALLIDLDRFKQVNDTFGHNVGDRVLVEFADILRETVRPGDIAARYGGEEFFVACPDTSLAQATALAETVRLASERRLVVTPAGSQIGFTCSIGVCEWRPGEALETLICRADDALYEAKNSGRNRVVVG